MNKYKILRKGNNPLFHIANITKKDSSHILTGEEIVDLLNGQDEKIKELEQENKNLRRDHDLLLRMVNGDNNV